MSSSNPSDPRLLLPEWLRDGDAPVAAPSSPATPSAPAVETLQPQPVAVVETLVVAPATPFSDRLSLDTRLDPGQLVSAADLPKWLGGLERTAPPVAMQPARANITTAAAPAAIALEEPEPYEGLDAPQDGVIDVEINGWVAVAAAIGLLILLIAAVKLYLS